MLKGPELFSHLETIVAVRRDKSCINSNEKLGLITDEMLTKAYETPLELADRKKFKYKAPFLRHIL